MTDKEGDIRVTVFAEYTPLRGVGKDEPSFPKEKRMAKHDNPNHKAYHNEHLARRHEIKRVYHLKRHALKAQKGEMERVEYRVKRRTLHLERKVAKNALKEERRTFRREHKLPLYPIMADIFDIAEESRAEPNSRTPFDQEVRVQKDVVYKTVDGEDLVMDLYFPAEMQEGVRYPVVMDIPGGGWMIHNRPRRDGYARCFATMGAVVAVIDHRLCPRVFFPINLADCIDAYNYLVDHADLYSIDPDNIVVTGDSSGGHLSACVGAAASSPEYVAKTGVPALKTKPVGLILISGAFNFERMYHIPMTNTLIVRYVSGQPTRKAFRRWQYYKEANPQNYINPDYPECYNNGGATDFLCLGEAAYMAKQLNKHGVRNEVRIGRNFFNSDHCYVLRFPFAPARRDALDLYRWYRDREARLGVDLSAGFGRVETFLTQYEDVMAGKVKC